MKRRICRLLACIAPLTAAEIAAALGVSLPRARSAIQKVRVMGLIHRVPASLRQRLKQHGHLTAWALIP